MPQGHDLDGIGNLAAQIDQNRRLSNTIEALSPLGSRHIYIKWLDAVDIANSASQLAPGVAARVDGGMLSVCQALSWGQICPIAGRTHWDCLIWQIAWSGLGGSLKPATQAVKTCSCTTVRLCCLRFV